MSVNRNDALIAAVALGVAAYVLWWQSNDVVEIEVPMGYLPEVGTEPIDVPEDTAVWWGEDITTELDDADIELGDEAMTHSDDQKLAAALFMIRASEHRLQDARSGLAYSTFYGGSRFNDFSDHPVITKEKVGVTLPDAMCRAAGLGPGCVSTAAGGYQIIKPTWNEFRVGGSWGPRLVDFSPASQDEAARRILLRDGALALLYRGDFSGFLRIASKRWASLPGSKAQQNPKSLDYAVQRYEEGLNTFA